MIPADKKFKQPLKTLAQVTSVLFGGIDRFQSRGFGQQKLFIVETNKQIRGKFLRIGHMEQISSRAGTREGILRADFAGRPKHVPPVGFQW